jgi:hypothetical protein
LNKDCSDLWVADVARLLALGVRRMSFRHEFSASKAEKDELPSFELNLSETYLMLQLKISHDLADIVVIDRF